MTDAELAPLITAQGFENADAILAARWVAKVGLPVALAMFRQESSGSQIWGHDYYLGGIKAPGWGWGPVTEANVEEFLALRKATGRSNGCGMGQLTSPSLQDECMAAGGLWVPQHNAAVALHYLHDLIVSYGVEQGCAAYNGGAGGRTLPGPAAYGRDCLTLAEHYKAIGLGTVIGVLP